jgi:hypothetical protein
LFASYSTFNVIKWFDMDKKKSTQKNWSKLINFPAVSFCTK